MAPPVSSEEENFVTTKNKKEENNEKDDDDYQPEDKNSPRTEEERRTAEEEAEDDFANWRPLPREQTFQPQNDSEHPGPNLLQERPTPDEPAGSTCSTDDSGALLAEPEPAQPSAFPEATSEANEKLAQFWFY